MIFWYPLSSLLTTIDQRQDQPIKSVDLARLIRKALHIWNQCIDGGQEWIHLIGFEASRRPSARIHRAEPPYRILTIVLEVFAETSLFMGKADLSHNRDNRSSVFKVSFGRPASSSTRVYFRKRPL